MKFTGRNQKLLLLNTNSDNVKEKWLILYLISQLISSNSRNSHEKTKWFLKCVIQLRNTNVVEFTDSDLVYPLTNKHCIRGSVIRHKTFSDQRKATHVCYFHGKVTRVAYSWIAENDLNQIQEHQEHELINLFHDDDDDNLDNGCTVPFVLIFSVLIKVNSGTMSPQLSVTHKGAAYIHRQVSL